MLGLARSTSDEYPLRGLGFVPPVTDEAAGFIQYASVAAFSGRTIIQGYTGPLIRLRRVSDDAESDFSAGSDGELDLVAIAAWAGGDAFLTTWYDQSGNGLDIFQVTDGAQPQFFGVEAATGRVGFKYVGGVREMQSAAGLTFTQPNETITVMSSPVTAPSTMLFDGLASRQLAFFDTSGRLTINAGSSINEPSGAETPRDNGTPQVVAAQFNGASSVGRANGTQVFTGNPGSADVDGGVLLGRSQPSTIFLTNGHIFELIYVDSILSDEDRSLTEDNQIFYYGV